MNCIVFYSDHKGDMVFSHTCGGAIINKNQFLTAGHCIFFGMAFEKLPKWQQIYKKREEETKKGQFMVLSGTGVIRPINAEVHGENITDGFELIPLGQKRHTIVNIKMHPEYHFVHKPKFIAENDIALVTVNPPFDLNSRHVSKIALEEKRDQIPKGMNILSF